MNRLHKYVQPEHLKHHQEEIGVFNEKNLLQNLYNLFPGPFSRDLRFEAGHWSESWVNTRVGL